MKNSNPADIFLRRHPIVDYGPLDLLIGKWTGSHGSDLSPESDGPNRTDFSETLVFEPIGPVENAASQGLAVVRYHQYVERISDGHHLHDQVGYWMWDAERKLIMQSVSIPRGVNVLAGGHAEGPPERVTLSVEASGDDRAEWTIQQAPFMREHARTTRFRHELVVTKTELRYQETTEVAIYGKRSFQHTDHNLLHRVD